MGLFLDGRYYEDGTPEYEEAKKESDRRNPFIKVDEMPTLSVIAVFVARLGWVQYQFADQSRSEVQSLSITDCFVRAANDLDSSAWAALQQALLTPDTWVQVKEK